MVPKINCKFCGKELETKGLQTDEINTISCFYCKSKIWNSLTNYHFFSKHTVYFNKNNITAELLILDNISIHTNYVFKKTTFEQYIILPSKEDLQHLEQKHMLTIPLRDIDPLDPKLEQQIQMWLTFS